MARLFPAHAGKALPKTAETNQNRNHKPAKNFDLHTLQHFSVILH